MSLILDGTNGLSDVDGTAATPAIRGTDANTGIFFPAADTIAFSEGGAESMRVDSAGNLGIGTASPSTRLQVNGISTLLNSGLDATLAPTIYLGNSGFPTTYLNKISTSVSASSTLQLMQFSVANGASTYADVMTLNGAGNVLVGKTSAGVANAGAELLGVGVARFTVNNGTPVEINRLGNDGDLIDFYQATVKEGSISVSGTTVSYNGGHLARWSQLLDGSKDDTILKGTVLSNLDDMCVWEKDGAVAENEQLNKMKVSDVEGDTNVAGVFVNWTMDEKYGVDDMNVAMTGDMIIRIADGVVVKKGDLLMSAGDGTAKPQGDDIVRSKTIAKVTSNYVTCTYADGSYCVPCVLMAC